MPRWRLAIIEAGRGREAAFEELRSSGEFFLLFVTRASVSNVVRRCVDELLMVDTNDTLATVDALRGRSLDGAMTLLEWYVPTTEAVRVTLGLPGNGEDVALTCRDKGVMRERLWAAGLPVPRFARVDHSGQLAGAVAEVGGFPCVLKPTDGTGSTNVVLVSSEAELRQGFERIKRAVVNSRGQRLTCRALVEQFVDGREYAVDALSAGGEHVLVALHEYTMSPLPYFTETGYFTPPQLRVPDVDIVTRLTTAALDTVGITSGPSHCEVKWGADGPIVVEVAARYGGAHIPELVRATTGLRYYLEGARIACGASHLPVPEQVSAGAMRHVYARQNGRLTAIEGLDDLSTLPGYLAVHLGAVGREVSTEIRDYTAPVGHVLFTAPTAAEALARADDAAARLRLVIDPGLVQA